MQQLLDYLQDIRLIDAHEHLITPEEHMKTEYTFMHIFYPYANCDLLSAGLDPYYTTHHPRTQKETQEFWQAVKEPWESIRYGAYGTVVRRTLKTFFKIDEINENTIFDIADKLNATKKSSHYEDILIKKCHIEYVLNQNLGDISQTHYKETYIKGYYLAWNLVSNHALDEFFIEYPDASIEEYGIYLKNKIRKIRLEGAVLIKYGAEQFSGRPSRDKAKDEFEAFRKNRTADIGTFRWYFIQKSIDYLAENDLVCAVHTGVWQNPYDRSPQHLFPWVAAHPEITFDIYHMGIPFIRSCAFLAKNYPNAYLNLCWTYIVSPQMVELGLKEYIDLVPMNKFIAFGGDFNFNPEHVYTHLQIAKECLSRVFGEQIMCGRMDLESARHILEQWFYTTPKKLYHL